MFFKGISKFIIKRRKEIIFLDFRRFKNFLVFVFELDDIFLFVFISEKIKFYYEIFVVCLLLYFNFISYK